MITTVAIHVGGDKELLDSRIGRTKKLTLPHNNTPFSACRVCGSALSPMVVESVGGLGRGGQHYLLAYVDTPNVVLAAVRRRM